MGVEKVLLREGGEYQDSPLNCMLCFTKFTVAKKIMTSGDSQDFHWKNFYPTVEFFSQCGNLNFVGNLLVFQKFRLSKTNYASEGNLTLFCRDIVCLTVGIENFHR